MIQEATADQAIACFKGTIVTVGKVTESQRFDEENLTKGEYRFQHVIAKDRAGDKIDITLKDRPVIKGSVGKQITLLAKVQTGAHAGLKGLKAVDNTNKNTEETERVLWATPACEVIIGNVPEKEEPENDSSPPEPDNAEPETEAPPVKQKTTAPVNRPVATDNGAIKEARQHLARGINAMLLCLDSASYVAQAFQGKWGMEMQADQFQAITSTFFIKLDKTGVIDTLPTVPLPYNKPADKE
jgi:hypothetical protein